MEIECKKADLGQMYATLKRKFPRFFDRMLEYCDEASDGISDKLLATNLAYSFGLVDSEAKEVVGYWRVHKGEKNG